MVVGTRLLPVEILADASAQVAATSDLRTALAAIAEAGAAAAGADVCVLRVLEGSGELRARAVAPAGSALGAELAGT
ncbi:MAG: hypothetical protein ACRDM1_07255, partial [Gaiellaceae bacterium]